MTEVIFVLISLLVVIRLWIMFWNWIFKPTYSEEDRAWLWEQRKRYYESAIGWGVIWTVVIGIFFPPFFLIGGILTLVMFTWAIFCGILYGITGGRICL